MVKPPRTSINPVSHGIPIGPFRSSGRPFAGGYAIPMIVILASVILTGVMAIHYLTSSSIRHVRRIEEQTVVDSGLDSMMSIAVTRLKRASWIDRWYADPLKKFTVQPKFEEILLDYYGGELTCYMVVEDCFNITGNLLYDEDNHVDVFVVGTYKGASKTLFARLRMRYPDKYDPRSVEVIEYRHYEKIDISVPENRNRIRAEVATEAMARRVNEFLVPVLQGALSVIPAEAPPPSIVQALRNAASTAPVETLKVLSTHPTEGTVGQALSMARKKDIINACFKITDIETTILNLDSNVQRVLGSRVCFIKAMLNMAVVDRVRVMDANMGTTMLVDWRSQALNSASEYFSKVIDMKFGDSPYRPRCYPGAAKMMLKSSFGNWADNREKAKKFIQAMKDQCPPELRVYGTPHSRVMGVAGSFEGILDSAFVMARGGSSIVFRKPNGDFVIILNNFYGGSITEIAVSPDGSRVAFVSNGEGNLNQVFTVDCNGTDVNNLSKGVFKRLGMVGECTNPSFSPDGTRVVFEFRATPSDPRRICAANCDGSVPMVLNDVGQFLNPDFGSSYPCEIAGSPSADFHAPIYVPYKMVHEQFNFMRLGDYVLYVQGDSLFYERSLAGRGGMFGTGVGFKRAVCDLTPLGGGSRVVRLFFGRNLDRKPSEPAHLYFLVFNGTDHEVWKTSNTPGDLSTEDLFLESSPWFTIPFPQVDSVDIFEPSGPPPHSKVLVTALQKMYLYRANPSSGTPGTLHLLSSDPSMFTTATKFSAWAPLVPGF